MRVDKIKIMTRQNNKQARTKQEKNLKLTIPSVGKDVQLLKFSYFAVEV